MSILNFVQFENPYKLDILKDGEFEIPALTRKNADFIEAIVHLDSNYGRDLDSNSKPDENFDVNNYYLNSNGLFCGSTAFWINAMKNGERGYEECLLGAIIAIDRTNSTRLESVEDGRERMRDIVLKKCPDTNALKRELRKDFNKNPEDHLIGLLSCELPAKNKSGNRSNLSFASKFCAYASQYLECGKEYSKYDNVVASRLDEYISYYLKKSVKVSEIKYNSQKKKKYKKDEEKLKYVLSVYREYSSYIREIVDSLEFDMSLEEMDHIIWYACKGRWKYKDQSLNIARRRSNSDGY